MYVLLVYAMLFCGCGGFLWDFVLFSVFFVDFCVFSVLSFVFCCIFVVSLSALRRRVYFFCYLVVVVVGSVACFRFSGW